MPRPSHRLDLVLVFVDPPPKQAVPQFPWRQLLPAGFDDWRAVLFEREQFVANHQGGFRVSCPGPGGNLAPQFSKALSAWRHGAQRRVQCPHCQQSHDLAELAFAPQAAFGRFAVELHDVVGIELDAGLQQRAMRDLGPFSLVLRRVG